MLITRQTSVVQGPLAYGMRRAAAARFGQSGLQILSVAQLAARLAGGFFRLATAEVLDPEIRGALAAGGFRQLEKVRGLPGMTRAVGRTLRKAWHSELDFRERQRDEGGRIADLALIEERVRRALPASTLLPRDLRDAALTRVRLAPKLLGPVRIEGVHYIEPVWRPLINKLCSQGPVVWDAPAQADTDWFAGEIRSCQRGAAERSLVSCADPRHEALESLRWVRQLLASGQAHAHEIALAATGTEEWDDHVSSLAQLAQLRIHFPHGVTCLSTRDGQRCAALVDILLNGLTQARVRRLFGLASGQGLPIDSLPRGWFSVPRSATLATIGEWKRAFDVAYGEGSACHTVVLPLLDIVAQGVSAADQAAALFLRGRSKILWGMATRAAPVEALELTLRSIRVADDYDPADSIVWCPAAQLAAAPRPFVRLLGLTARSWPRRPGEDAVLPGHLLSATELDPNPPAVADRRAFDIICASASKGLVLSRSRRNGQGTLLGASPLLLGAEGAFLTRARAPAHAVTESDRLSARPAEARETPQVKAALSCWQDWHDARVTAHDGLVRAAHPAIVRALARVQSATSLTRLLRDPLGFVWRYALGWQASEERDLPLSLPPDQFGRLVHELLRRAVNSLEPVPGLNAAKDYQIEVALDQAATAVLASWPIEGPVPPHVLWTSTVRLAAQMGFAGLKLQEVTQAGTRSWTEVPFGLDPSAVPARELPWNPASPVAIPGTRVTIRGSVDRLDLRDTGFAVRVTDYKTGAKPRDPQSIIIAGGRELQRVLYALACRQLLPETKEIRARLIYLRDPLLAVPLNKPDMIFPTISDFVAAALTVLEAGKAVPGPDTEQEFNDLRFALPVSPGYFRRKGLRFREHVGPLTRFWNRK